ncbi:MAG: orotate phosphoribosyltransferase [Candidatus Glassbacteria bacterium]|nr:orotate phosphoribosyltransferase [Candidatus Glassbacteria bacterium]
MTPEQVLELFSKYDAYLEGHFRLTSGLHSPHYFQCARVLQHPAAAEKLGADLAAKLGPLDVGTVLSPAMGGLIIGHELGRALGVRAVFAERRDGKMTLRRFALERGERVVVVEDVVTTGGSLLETVRMAEEAGAEVVGTCCLVDRSGDGPPPVPGLVSLVKADVVTYEPENCPLCAQGLELVKPGSRNVRQG